MAERLFKWGKALTIYDCHPYMTDYLFTHKVKSTDEQWRDTVRQLGESSWVYVGGLQYHISEANLYSLFAKAGSIDEMIFGVNKKNPRQKVGFAFIKYLTHSEAICAVNSMNGIELLNKRLNVQLDPGFEEGRQYGRGQSGHQKNREKEHKLKKIEKKLKFKKFKKKRNKKHAKHHTNQQQNANDNNNEVSRIETEMKMEKIKDEGDEDGDIDIAIDDKTTENNANHQGQEQVTVQEEQVVIQEVEVIKQNDDDKVANASEFDIVCATKRRKLDRGIAYQVKRAREKIDRKSYLKRKKEKKKERDALDEITDMLMCSMKPMQDIDAKDDIVQDEPSPAPFDPLPPPHDAQDAICNDNDQMRNDNSKMETVNQDVKDSGNTNVNKPRHQSYNKKPYKRYKNRKRKRFVTNRADKNSFDSMMRRYNQMIQINNNNANANNSNNSNSMKVDS
eukprot:568507_1